MLPASDGDASVLSWDGNGTHHRALIDLGRTGTYRAVKPTLCERREFELLLISHIDADHIAGCIPYFNESDLPFKVRSVWFNGFAQLTAANERLPPSCRTVLGAAQAEKVTEGIIQARLAWNSQFTSGVVSVDSPEAKERIVLEGGLQITLLSPSDKELAKLIPVWNRELENAHLRTTDQGEVEEAITRGRVRLGSPDVQMLASVQFVEDKAQANGSSVAFIAEKGDKRVLMGADSHPSVLEESLKALGAFEGKPIKLDCLKVPHHGSKFNTSPDLLKLIDCTRFAFSTDGSRHNHPDGETIARILHSDLSRKKTLYFNYRHESAEQWDREELRERWNYECVFPERGQKGLEFDI